jgi:nucleoside-diphosphate-sugar epimerase
MKSLFELVESTIPRIQLSKLKEFYSGKNIIVTGGASFIGSNLVELLLALNAKIKVIDDFSSGSPDNLLGKEEVDLVQDDLRNIDVAQKLIRNAEVVFHLAAIHGGRGFIEKYKQEMLANLAIDNNVFSAGLENGITNMVHASSACASTDAPGLHTTNATGSSPKSALAAPITDTSAMAGWRNNTSSISRG